MLRDIIIYGLGILLYILVSRLLFFKKSSKNNDRLHMRVALLKIRKIRRDLTIPDHEQDEIYNIANEALNDYNSSEERARKRV